MFDAEGFGKTVRILRKNKGFNLIRFAMELNMHPTYLGQIERGTRPPTFEIAINIANYFKIGFDTKVTFDYENEYALIHEILNKTQSMNPIERKFIYKVMNDFLFFNK